MLEKSPGRDSWMCVDSDSTFSFYMTLTNGGALGAISAFPTSAPDGAPLVRTELFSGCHGLAEKL